MAHRNKILNVARIVLQYLLATLLLATAIGKLLDIQGFAQVIESYQIFSGWITAPMGLAMSLTELGLSIWLFSGRKLHLAALAAVTLHVIFTLWTTVSLLRGLELSNCGCFGIFLARPLTWITVIEDIIMTSASLALYFLARNSQSKKN